MLVGSGAAGVVESAQEGRKDAQMYEAFPILAAVVISIALVHQFWSGHMAWTHPPFARRSPVGALLAAPVVRSTTPSSGNAIVVRRTMGAASSAPTAATHPNTNGFVDASD